MNFIDLVTTTQRADGYINATRWCAEFGYEMYEWKRLPETKARVKALEGKLSIGMGGKIPVLITEGKGRGSQTWVHPIMAIHLAQYLSPEFANFVAEIFQRYLEGDVTLADDIIQHQDDPKKLKWLQARLEGKLARFKFTDVLKEHGVTGRGYSICTDIANKILFGQTAKELQISRQVKHTRDGLDEVELAALNLHELKSARDIETKGARGNYQCQKICEENAKRVKRVFE